MQNTNNNNIYGFLLFSAVLILMILNFSSVWRMAITLFDVIKPLILGASVAYILNLLLLQYEKVYFPSRKSRVIESTKRPLCLLLSVITILAILSLIVGIVVPQLAKTATALGAATSVLFEQAQRWIAEREAYFPSIALLMRQSNINWEEIQQSIFSYFTRGLGNILQSSVSFAGSIATVILNLLIGIVFAFYLLMSKERVGKQVERLQKRFLKERHAALINHILNVANRSFSSYFSVQCLEAVVLGTLCTVGMLIFRFPYAGTVGVFVGATALIPILGAYLGAAVGAFLILVVDPTKAIWFVVFIIVLQQLESNLIYPRVVGTSIGLPGIWVLAAIIVFGGIGGVLGMLVGVPITAVAYTLLKEATSEVRPVEPQQDGISPEIGRN